MSRRSEKKDDLDTETTFADMNVPGFKWYDPTKKNGDNKHTHKPKISRKEYWQMVRAAFSAYLPVFMIVIAVFGIMVCIAWLWVS